MKKKSLKKWQWVLIVIGIFLIVGVINGIVDPSDTKNEVTTSAETEKETIPETTIIETEEETTIEETSEEKTSEIQVTDFLIPPEFTSEKNTSAMVDEIASTAKKIADTLSNEQANEIINVIREAGHQFYNGPEEMEKYMWYGYLLDYKYEDGDPRSELGTDLCQAIKYVYRNVESVLDDSTHANLLQIDKDLAKIQ